MARGVLSSFDIFSPDLARYPRGLNMAMPSLSWRVG